MPPAAGQRAVLTATEFSFGGLGAFAASDFVGAGFGVGRRVSPQTRVALFGAGGTIARAPAARLEAMVQFLVTPAARAGAGLYGGAGIAVQTARDRHGVAYLVAVMGAEGAPGRRGGWFLEVGLGGGVRGAVGWRWRRFPAWWSPR